MKRIKTYGLLLATAMVLVSASTAHAAPGEPALIGRPSGREAAAIGPAGKLLTRSGPSDPSAAWRASVGAAAAWEAPAGATVTPTQCQDEPMFLCGSVSVPLDRADPGGERIRIAFRVLPHGDPTGAPDPIFISDGGPGFATTFGPSFWVFLLESLTDRRDLVMIDARGTGGSGVIRCGDLQDGWASTKALFRAIRRCGDQLGENADRYGSGDIALDVEAVRRALGYGRINYFAGSYGTVVEQAYASRFPQHLRAIVADAGMPVTDAAHAWAWNLDHPRATVRAAVLSCRRAPSCAARHPHAGALIEALVERLGDAPLEGIGRDLFGNDRRVSLDQHGLFVVSLSDPRNPGELVAAAHALLRHGDRAPLLRLAAEFRRGPTQQGPQGAPRTFSMGANVAAYCNDQDFVFDRTAPRAVRRQQYADAKAALPADTFAPFTVEGWDPNGFLGMCTEWPAPDRFIPAVPAGPQIDVPVLVLKGDLDLDVPMETTDRLAAMFADPEVVEVRGAAHITTAWSECARALAARFIRALDAGDTSCGATPSVVFQAASRFPRTSNGAPQASPGAGDQSTARDRRAVWSAVHTVIDAWLRSFRQPAPVADGAGLRAGSFHADYASFDDHAEIALHDARFVRDVAVRGDSTLSYDLAHPRLRAEVRIHGAGTAPGELRMSSQYWFENTFGPIRVSGQIGGRHVELTVPGN